MNWFRQNQFLGTFLAVLAVATLACAYFLFSAKSGFNEAKNRFDENAAELARLQGLAPFPSTTNLKNMKKYAEEYAATLNKAKEDLKTRVLPVTPMAPNEFQSRLRQAVTEVSEKARVNKVKLPENFNLGFDEYASALPNTAVAPLLGQQLAQVELLLNIILDARVESLTVFRRMPLAEERAAAPTPTPGPGRRGPAANSPTGPKLIERGVEAAFVSTPAAARRVLNQISSSSQQFYVVRTVHVRNENEKGPAREKGKGVSAPASAEAAPPTGAAPGGKAPPGAALNFIVGNERVETAAKIEMARFNF